MGVVGTSNRGEPGPGRSARFRYSPYRRTVTFNGDHGAELLYRFPDSGAPAQDQDFPRASGMEGRIRAERIHRRPTDEQCPLQQYTFWRENTPLSKAIRSGEVELLGVKLLDGQPMYYLGHTPKAESMAVALLYIDPSRGYSIVSIIRAADFTAQTRIAETVKIELREVIPGVWFPIEVINTFGMQRQYVTQVTVEEVRLNEPLDQELFTLDFPPGTEVKDDR